MYCLMRSATGLWLTDRNWRGESRSAADGGCTRTIPNSIILFLSSAADSVERADADADFHHRRVFRIWEGRGERFELVTSHAMITIINVLQYVLLNNNIQVKDVHKLNIVVLYFGCDRLTRAHSFPPVF